MCIAQVSSEDEIKSEDIPPQMGLYLYYKGIEAIVLYNVMPALSCVSDQLGPSEDQLMILSAIWMAIDQSFINTWEKQGLSGDQWRNQHSPDNL